MLRVSITAYKTLLRLHCAACNAATRFMYTGAIAGFALRQYVDQRTFVALMGFEPILRFRDRPALNALPYLPIKIFGATAKSIRLDARSKRHHPVTPRLRLTFTAALPFMLKSDCFTTKDFT